MQALVIIMIDLLCWVVNETRNKFNLSRFQALVIIAIDLLCWVVNETQNKFNLSRFSQDKNFSCYFHYIYIKTTLKPIPQLGFKPNLYKSDYCKSLKKCEVFDWYKTVPSTKGLWMSIKSQVRVFSITPQWSGKIISRSW